MRTALSLPMVFLLSALLGCGRGESSTSEVDVGAAPPLVLETTSVVREELTEPILGTGSVYAVKTTNVGPRVDGIIEEVFVNVGDRVKTGDPLFRTRETDYRIRLEYAEADVQLARAEAKQSGRSLERVRTLRRKMVVSKEELEGAETRLEIGTARVEAAKAALARARQDLEDTVVRAPYDGVITRRVIDEGAMMRTMMSSGSAVVQIMMTEVVMAIIHVAEVHLPRIAIGTRGLVRIDGLDREIESRVQIVNDLVDAASHSVEVRLPIRNEDLAVKPGLFVTAKLLPEPRVVEVLDRNALMGSGEERCVFVEQDGRAIRKPVRVRDLDALRVEVLEGLEPGDRVLIGSELSRVTDGAPIQVGAPVSESSRVAL
jgi:RND family efflux transporter MFP subunit